MYLTFAFLLLLQIPDIFPDTEEKQADFHSFITLVYFKTRKTLVFSKSMELILATQQLNHFHEISINLIYLNRLNPVMEYPLIILRIPYISLDYISKTMY